MNTLPTAPQASRRALLMGFAAAATPMAPALASALSEPAPAATKADEADPIFDVIARHSCAHLAMRRAYAANDLDDAPDDADPAWPWDPNKAPALERYDATALPLLTTSPTTVDGAAELLNYVLGPSYTALDPAEDESILEDECGFNGERGEAAKNFLPQFARALRNIVARGQA
jgi:hypothetical protein